MYGSRYFHKSFLVILALLAAQTVRPAPAVTFNLIFDEDGADGDGQASTYPLFDPDGSLLQSIMSEAAIRWSDIVEDSHTMTIKFLYGTISVGAVAQAGIDGINNGNNVRVETGRITFSDVASWYLDPTPANDLEFDFTQTLYQDLDAGTAAADFTNSGAAEPLLEIGYRGNDNGSDLNVANNLDILSTALHEIGHLMGLTAQLPANDTETVDGDYDLPPSLLAGAGMGANISQGGTPTNNQSHLNNTFPLMSGAGAALGVRRRISATDVLSAAAVSGWSLIDLPRQDFLNTGLRNFAVASNWEGNSVPDSLDDAYIRRSGAQVFSNAVVDVVSNLYVGNTAEFGVSSGLFLVSGTATIHEDTTSGVSRIFVNSGAELQANLLDIDGGKLVMLGGLFDVNDIRMTNTSNSVATISGHGTIDVQTELSSSSGAITATSGGTLTFQSSNAAVVVDLGDFFNPTDVSAVNGDVVFDTGITSDFWGSMTVGTGRYVTVNQAWTMKGGVNDLVFNGGTTLGTAAELRGSAVEISGSSVVVDKQARITAPITFSGFATVNLPDSDDALTFDAPVTYDDGMHSGRGKFVYNDQADMLGGEIEITVIELGTSGTFNLQGGEVVASKVFPGDGTFTFTGGRLQFDEYNGSLTNSGGTLAPGNPLGTSYVAGKYNQNAGGTLEIEIGGAGSGEFDVLDTGVSATLGGELDVILTGGFMPVLGQMFPIILGSIGGTFVTTDNDLPALTNGLGWKIQYFANSVRLDVVAAPLTGDHNNDGIVDAADYVLWRKSPSAYGGDPAGYNEWRQHFGDVMPAGSGANAAVPEGSSVIMLVVGAFVLAGMQGARRGRA